LCAALLYYSNSYILLPGSNCVCFAGVLPCLPYSQQTKMRRRGNISLKLIAEMCVKAGFTHIITIDLHSKVIIFFLQCFGSLIWVGWIRIRIQKGKKTHENRKKGKKCWMSLLRAECFCCCFDVLYAGLGIAKLQFFARFFLFLVIKTLDPDPDPR
jgi:hypothetical protein